MYCDPDPDPAFSTERDSSPTAATPIKAWTLSGRRLFLLYRRPLARSCADWLCAFRSVLMLREERHKNSHCVLRPHGWISWEDVNHTKPLRFLELKTSVKAVRQLVWRQRQSCRENTFLCDSMGNMKMKSSISGNPGANNLHGSCEAPEWTWFI